MARMAHEPILTTVDGEPLAPESLKMLAYLRTRGAGLSTAEIGGRIGAAAEELENAIAPVTQAESRLRPFPDKWTIAEVVDHIAQTQVRASEELRHLLADRRPPGPPVYEALRTGAPAWAPWAELVEGLRSANADMVALLASAPAGPAAPGAPTVRTIVVANRTLADGAITPQIFVAELPWREYALLQRLHLLNHRTSVKKLRAAIQPS